MISRFTEDSSRRFAWGLVGLVAALAVGCVEDAAELEPNSTPRIDERSPDSDVTVELSPLGLITEFHLLRYEDANPEQTLFFRAVVEYGGIAIATESVAVEAEARALPLTFDYAPCEFPQRQGLDARTDDSAVLVIGLSDSPFVEPDRRVFIASDPDGNDRIGAALATESGDAPAVVEWGLSFEGSCEL